MSRPPLQVDAQLEASLRRISGALAHNRDRYAAMVGQIAGTSAEVAERITERTDQVTARIAERHQRRMDRWHRRDERRWSRRWEPEGRDDGADIPKGVVFAVAAIICVLFAVMQPGFFWMVFVALGFGMSAASLFGRAATRRRLEREGQAKDESENIPAAKPVGESAGEGVPSAPSSPGLADPKVTRIQTLCDKLLAELESGPPIVREVVTQPRATIDGLRRACVETARREHELRSVLAEQDAASLVAERDALATRLTNEHDEIVRDRLSQASGALDQQLAHRAELTTAAARLEAENTRILYTLENLHVQLLRARSTDIGAPELGGKLRDSLRDLGIQIDAVAEALEFASAPVGTESRTAAARRAAQAQQAQRQ